MLNNYTQRYIIIIDIYAKKEKYSALNSIRFSTLKEKYCNLEGRKEPQFSFLFIICVVPSAGPFIVVKCLSEWKISADILTVHTTHANQCVLSKEHWYREVLILVVPGSGRQGSHWRVSPWGGISDTSFPSRYALRDAGSLPVWEIRLISIQVLKLNVCREYKILI